MPTQVVARTRRALLRVAFCLAMASGLNVSAQDVLVGAPPDTVAVDSTLSDSLPPGPIVRFRRRAPLPRIHRAMADSLPARLYAFELVDLLRDEAGSFLYDFSNYGWPHVWSPYGLGQLDVGLAWNTVDMSDLFTGRARFEVVPVGASESPVFSIGGGRRLANVSMATRTYEKSELPLTELRYQSGGGLQKVTALHTQTRRIQKGSGLLNLLFWYRGEGSDGEYPGSRLRRGRQVYGRVLYARRGWSLEITELNTRHPLAAHGGVIQPVTSDFNSVYQRVGAQVVDEDSRRQTLRNDIFVRWTRNPSDRSETAIVVGRTTENLQYRRPGDTLEVASARNFSSISQRLRVGTNEIVMAANGSITKATARTDTLDFDTVSDRRLRLEISDFLSLGGLQAHGQLGLESRSEGTGVTSSASVRIPLGPVSLSVDAASRPETATIMEMVGFGRFVTVEGDRPLGRVNILSGRMSVEANVFDLSVIAAVTSSASWRDYFETGTSDSIRVRAGAGKLNVVTTGLDVGFRRHERRGFYLTAKPTLFTISGSTTSDLQRYEASLPDFYAVGRLGARYLIFQGDLNLDISVRGRFWSQFMSRSLHTQTGLLALRLSGGRPVESSAALDLVIEGGVRVATLFLAYENFLSGTNAIPGNMLVPVYPLAERRLRFGVFWPISN